MSIKTKIHFQRHDVLLSECASFAGSLLHQTHQREDFFKPHPWRLLLQHQAFLRSRWDDTRVCPGWRWTCCICHQHHKPIVSRKSPWTEDLCVTVLLQGITLWDDISLCCFSLRRFGGGVYSPKTGIILNNELSDFCKRADTVRAGEVTDRNIAFQAKPIEFKTLLNVDTGSVSSLMLGLIVVIGEQPPSSMTPVILESESGRILVIGGSGGSLITAAVASVTQLSSVCVQYSCV